MGYKISRIWIQINKNIKGVRGRQYSSNYVKQKKKSPTSVARPFLKFQWTSVKRMSLKLISTQTGDILFNFSPSVLLE